MTTTKKTPTKTKPATTDPVVEETPKTALATRDTKAGAVAMQDALDVFAQDGAQYAADFGTENRAINFLRIAQSNSPVAKKLEAEYIPGVSEGTFYTSITRRALDTVLFLPVFWTKNFTWWKPRNSGGGLVRNHGTDKTAARVLEAERDDNNKLVLRNAVPGVPVVEVVEADLYFGFIIDEDGSAEECVLSLSSTQLPKARRWNTMIHALRHPKTGAPLPMFARAYHLATVGESNERGSWAGIKVAEGPMLPEITERWDILYAAAKRLADDCLRGARAEVVVDLAVSEVTITQATAPEEAEEDYYVEEDREIAGDDVAV